MALTNLSQITTSGIATGTDLNIRNITGAAATFTGNVTVGGTLTYDDVTNIDSVGLITARSGINVNSGDVNITSGNLALASATPMVVASNGSGHLRLGAGGSEKVRIKSNGYVGIGSADPTRELQVAAEVPQVSLISTNSTLTEYLFGDLADDNVGRLRYDHSDDSLEFWTNAAERLHITSAGHILPGADNTQDLGSSSARFANIYTGDLNLSNEGSSNDVDGTWGQYTIQEGENDLFLINKRTGKKYKFNLTEVD